MKKSLLLFFASICMQFLYSQTSGGPDAYGYTWKSSAHPTGPTYSWVDITSTGTEVQGLGDDNIVGPFSLAPGFQYYWYPVSQFYIGSNGYIGLNPTNIASPFPAIIPTAGGANDWIGMHLSDLKFDGAGNTGKCYYYSNSDSLVVSFIGVPYWVVASPGYSGSNTFQMIFSRIDKSITFNYQSMAAGTATIPIDNAVGIENNTGALGLQTYIDVVPANGSSVKYYYPTNVTYAVKDGGVNWNNNEENGAYFIPKANTAITLKSNIKNFGNQPLTNFSVTDTVYYGTNPLSNGNASISSLSPGSDTTITFSNSFFSQFLGIYTFSSNVQGITGDLVPVNNRQVQKIISVDIALPQYELNYSDGSPEGAGISWGGGQGGVAIYIEPPVYPVKIEDTRFHISANGLTPAGFSAMVYDDNGPNGTAGTLLDSVYVQPSNVVVGQYNVITPSNTNLVINSGGVYVVWYMDGLDIAISRDLSSVASQRTFEILGNTWGGYRDKQNEDFLMGMTVSNAPSAPTADFSIDSSNSPVISFFDISTKSPNQWHWDFDYNGDTSNVKNPTYSYAMNGTYNVCLIATNAIGSDTVCKTITISDFSGVGIEEDDLATILFYPNPTNEKGYIDMPENVAYNSITVYNVLGEKQKVKTILTPGNVELDLSKLAVGIYTYSLEVTTKQAFTIRGKFIVQ
jgi:PKD repeat protein